MSNSFSCSGGIRTTGRHNKAPNLLRNGRTIFRTLIGAFVALLFTTSASAVTVTFNSATDIPVTSAGYTATGTLTLVLNYPPLHGSMLTVVNNTALTPISGTFTGLAHGGTISGTFNGVSYSFVANYWGGDGNDLVLMPPTTGLAAWGLNSSGQLGDGVTTSYTTPDLVNMSGALSGKVIFSIAAGGGHTLALTSEGKVYAWGANSYGQLGDGTTTNRTTPVAVNMTGVLSGKTVVAISAGTTHSLALTSEGKLYAWGANSYRQLGQGVTPGDGLTLPSSVPVTVNMATSMSGKFVIAISSGGNHNLALTTLGEVYTWGLNTWGQCGTGAVGGQNIRPVAAVTTGSALSGKTVVAISAGRVFSLVLTADGKLISFGSDNYGQLGNGPTNVDMPLATFVDQTGVLAGKTVTAISAGGYHALALASDGKVYAWGNNGNLQILNGNYLVGTATYPAPVSLSAASPSHLDVKSVRAIAAGQTHNLFLTTDGGLYASGDGLTGQLGNGVLGNNGVTPVNTNVNLRAKPPLFLPRMPDANHSAVAWTVAPEIAVDDSTASPVTELADGTSTLSMGTLLLGQNTTRTFTIRNTGSTSLSNLAITVDGANSGDFTVNPALAVTSINAGASATFGIRFAPTASGFRSAAVHIRNTDGDETPFDIAFTGWANASTTVAAAFATPATVPITAPTGYEATGLTLNASVSFAPGPGTLLTVINNTTLNPIVGTFSNVPHGGTVTVTFGAQNYSLIANYFGGTGNDLVLMWPHYGVAAWGANDANQLGNGMGGTSISGASVPVNVNVTSALAGKTVTKVSSTSGSTLFLTADGKLYGSGVIGNGTNASTPAAINMTGVLAGKYLSAIAAGGVQAFSSRFGYNIHYPFFLTLASDGKVFAWGNNLDGQLGDGTTTTRTEPVAVNMSGALAGKTVIAVAAGGYHSLALSTEGYVYAWGYGADGELGDGGTTRKVLPVAVSRTGVLAGKTVVAISAGLYSSYALTADGLIVAWGRNSLGQLGDGTTTNRLSPVLVTNTGALAGKVVAAVAAGANHALALTSDGKIFGWGENTSGNLGDGTTANRLVPVATTMTGALAGKTVTAIFAARFGSTALTSDGLAFCWGGNGFGQVGDGSQTTRLTPVAVSAAGVLAGKTVVALPSGGAYSTSSFAIYSKPVPAPEIVVEDMTSGTPVNINSGGAMAFGQVLITKSTRRTYRIRNIGDAPLGGVVSTGPAPLITNSGTSQFGHGSFNAAVAIAPGGSVTASISFQPTVAGAHSATLSIANNDSNENPFVVSLSGTCGAVLSGKLGSPSSPAVTATSYTASGTTFKMGLDFVPTSSTSVQVVSNSGAGPISGTFDNVGQGQAVSLVHTSMGFPPPGGGAPAAPPTGPTNTAYSFIANYYGGDGNDLVLVPSITSIAAAGANAGSQLGDGTTTNRSTTVTVNSLGGIGQRPVLASAGGENHSLAVDADGKVWAWGLNASGQLGDGTNTSSSTAIAVSTAGVLNGKSVALLAAGANHSLVMTTEGKAYAWGANASGQLGDGTTTNTNAPAAVDMTGALNGKTISAIAAGANHCLALTSDGLVFAWGANASGQLGDGSTTNRSAPVAVSTAGVLNGKTIIAIAAGAEHSLALDSFGAIHAWGNNANGQLGNNSTTSSNVPVSVSAFGLFTRIAAGGAHSLAMDSFSVKTWGANGAGQLGDGTNSQALAPVMLNTFGALMGKTIAEVACGAQTTHIVTTDGGVYSCGLNASGQLADGTTTNRNTVVAAVTASGGLQNRPAFRVAAGSSAAHFLALAAIEPPGGFGAQVFPEIVVEDTTGGVIVNLADNGAALSFGKVPLNRSVVRSFKIRNTGGYDLTNIFSSLGGANSSEFAISSGIATALEPVEETEFTITFTPTTTPGARSATLQINNDDPNEAPFDLSFTAQATNDVYNEWAFDRGFVNAPKGGAGGDFDGDGISNLLELSFGLEPDAPDLFVMGVDGEFFYTGLPNIAPVGQGALQQLRVSFVRRKNAAAEGLTYTVQFSDDLVNWTDATEPEQLIGGDAEYDVIVVNDALPAPDPSLIAADTDTPAKPFRFGRVKVTGP